MQVTQCFGKILRNELISVSVWVTSSMYISVSKFMDVTSSRILVIIRLPGSGICLKFNIKFFNMSSLFSQIFKPIPGIVSEIQACEVARSMQVYSHLKL